MSNSKSVTNELRRDILAGAFPPGERLVELHLTDRYGCGRGAVRSALVELGAEGLVEREANRGATVRRITIEEAIQITEARAALESLIAGHAARNATEAERIELQAIVVEMGTAVAEDENIRYSELNALLHRRLREIGRHTVASNLVANLRNRASHQQFRLALMPGRSAESLGQHAAIVDAVVAGNESAASAAMEKHLLSVIDVLARWEGELEGQPDVESISES